MSFSAHMSNTGSRMNYQNPLDTSTSKARTPSPGRDYTSLLNESPTNKFYPELISDEEYNGKYARITTNKDTEVKRTLKSLEAEIQEMEKELNKVRAERNYFSAQLEILKKEKEMHIENHAKEKFAWEKEIRDLQNRMNHERKQLKEESFAVTKQLQEMQQAYKELKQKNENQIESFKKKIEENEQTYIQSLRKKESQIFSLKLQMDGNRVASKTIASPKHELRAKHASPKEKKRKSLKRSLRMPSPKTSRESNKNSQLDEISHMIVTLEKEEAELKQKIKELELSGTYERDKKKIADLIKRNDERLSEAKAIQEEMVRERFFNGGMTFR
ncbi:unnamed protein product [Blepharisma stoltei]|uniref:Uncharacterized protein n=1 Tax=Blepharisma stoltei TaxID=1481888 RepID=A0AAU9J761_9CILI|nr:unnamed protein product [Blepharisma stoltei]